MKKITFYLSTILIIILSRQVTAQNTIDKRILAGSWMGKLSVSGVTLRIVYNLSLIEKDSITATLDSPDQGAKNIKIGPVTLNGKDIKILAPVLMAEYSGTFVNDTLIDGSFKQAGMTFPLSLSRVEREGVNKLLPCPLVEPYARFSRIRLPYKLRHQHSQVS